MDAAEFRPHGGVIESAVEWAIYGFCPLDVAQWINVGVFDPVVAHRMVKAAVDQNDLKRIINRACEERKSAAFPEQKDNGGNTHEVCKCGKNIPTAAAR